VRSAAFLFVLGVWLGSTSVVVGVVAWNFAGIPHAMHANPRLAERAQLAPDADRDTRRASPIFVFAGELNRAIIATWNRSQLVLAALALLFAGIAGARLWPLLPLTCATIIVIALTFFLAPEIERRGRELDFVPRTEVARDEEFATFDSLHSAYVRVEGAKTLLLLAAVVLHFWSARRRTEDTEGR